MPQQQAGRGPDQAKFAVKTGGALHIPTGLQNRVKRCVYVFGDSELDQRYDSDREPITRVGVDGAWVGAYKHKSIHVFFGLRPRRAPAVDEPAVVVEIALNRAINASAMYIHGDGGQGVLTSARSSSHEKLGDLSRAPSGEVRTGSGSDPAEAHADDAEVGIQHGSAEEVAAFQSKTYCMKPPGSFLAVPPTVRRSTFNVGMPTPTGTAWPSLPQVPTPSSSFRSLPTMLTRVSTSGPLPIKRGAFDRGGDLAVFDHVGFAGGEDEFAVGDVDLASAEIDGVNAVLHGANDVFGIVLPGEHVSVGHARHGDVLVALAASVAGVGDAHQARGKLVAEIALQNSLFDEHGFLRGLAFVVDVERSAAPGHGAVVDDRAFFAGDALADEARECGSFLAIEVGFESVADRFVQQDAGPSGAEDDFHFSCGSFAGVELQDCLAGGFFGEKFGILVAEEEVEGDAASAAGTAAGGVVFGLGDAAHIHAGERLRIFGEGAVGGDDENVAEFVGVAGANFFDAGIVGAGGFVGAHDEFDLGADFGVDTRQRDGIKAAGGGFLKSGDR